MAHAFPEDLTMAFQPIFDLEAEGYVYAYEALLRRWDGGTAASRLNDGHDVERKRLDAACRAQAMELALEQNLKASLSVNASPSALTDKKYGLEETCNQARQLGFPFSGLIVEVTENERIEDLSYFSEYINEFRKDGIRIAIDDFGSGYSGLSVLSGFLPDIVKLDKGLVKGFDRDKCRQILVTGIKRLCDDLDLGLVAEGVETPKQLEKLTDLGIKKFQGNGLSEPILSQAPACDLRSIMGG